MSRACPAIISFVACLSACLLLCLFHLPQLYMRCAVQWHSRYDSLLTGGDIIAVYPSTLDVA
jgi:hypothetical protein